MYTKFLTTATALLLVGAMSVQAQDTTRSQTRIPIHKDMTGTTSSSTMSGTVAPATTTTYDTTAMNYMPTSSTEWYAPTGTTCSSVDVSAARAVAIKSSLYDPASMISPDSAKVVALCAVPGQIGSGEMNTSNGRPVYAVDIIPNHKRTHTKVIVDAQTGAVLSSKQFGGLRGATGWVRESWEHRENAKKAAKDTIPQ